MAHKLMLAVNSRRDGAALEQAFSHFDDIACVGTAYLWRVARVLLCQTQPDTVLLDLLMPDADAVAMLEDIDALSLRPKKPLVLALSATSEDRVLLCVANRVSYCFTKPFVSDEVALRIRELMRADGFGDVRSVQARPPDILETEITRHIRALGVPAHLKGYYYLRDALRIYMQSPFPKRVSITNEIYPAIAALYGTRADLVEHAMRNAIEIAWTRGDLPTIHSYFGYTVNDHKGKPSNLEFIAMIAEHMKDK